MLFKQNMARQRHSLRLIRGTTILKCSDHLSRRDYRHHRMPALQYFGAAAMLVIMAALFARLLLCLRLAPAPSSNPMLPPSTGAALHAL